MRSSQAAAPSPLTRYLAKLEISAARPARAPRAPPRDMVEIGRAAPGEGVLHALRREPQRHLEPVGNAPLRALRREQVVDRRRLERPPGRQLLVREADREAPRIVLAHLGVGVGHRRPVAVAGDVHRPDVGAGIAVHHPVGDSARPTPPPWREAGHDAAGDPEAGQAAHRADQRVAVGREGEGAVDDLLDAGVLEGREMPEADLQRRRDAVDVGLQQLVAEIPRRGSLRTTACWPSRRCPSACRRAPGANRARRRSRRHG